MLFSKITCLGLAALAIAHPGLEDEEYHQALKARAERAESKRALQNCASKLEARGVDARAIERRKATMEAHRKAKRVPVDGKLTESISLERNSIGR